MLIVGLQHQHWPPNFFGLDEIQMYDSSFFPAACGRVLTISVQVILARYVRISSLSINPIHGQRGGRLPTAGTEVMQRWQEEFQCS